MQPKMQGWQGSTLLIGFIAEQKVLERPRLPQLCWNLSSLSITILHNVTPTRLNDCTHAQCAHTVLGFGALVSHAAGM